MLCCVTPPPPSPPLPPQTEGVWYVRVLGDVQQHEHGHVPHPCSLQLGSVAGVQQALWSRAQVAVAQRLQDPPQVPAQAVVQTTPAHRQRVQQLLQAVVSIRGGEPLQMGFGLV